MFLNFVTSNIRLIVCEDEEFLDPCASYREMLAFEWEFRVYVI